MSDPSFDIDGNGGATTSLIVNVTGTDTPYTGVGVSSVRLVVNGKVQPNPLNDANGVWSGITALSPGQNTVAAVETVNGVQQTTRTIVYDYATVLPTIPATVAPSPAPSTPAAAASAAPPAAAPAPAPAPAVAITTANGVTNSSSITVAGTATAGSDVVLRDNGAIVSSFKADAKGAWGGMIGLTAGRNDISARVQDGSGGVVNSNTISELLDTTPPSVTMSAAPQFPGGTTAVLSGTVSDDTAVAGVEVYQGGTALGAATLDGHGGWTFTHDFGQGLFQDIRADATDTAGNVGIAAAPYVLATGIADHPYTSAFVETATDGSETAITTYRADGSVGSQTAPGPDGREVATGYQDGQWIFSLGGDVMTGNGFRESFVFQANMGHTEITDFVVGGKGHDTIGLSADDGFSSVAEILAQTTMRHGSAVIAITPDDTITLDGVTKAQLAHHPRDFGILV